MRTNTSFEQDRSPYQPETAALTQGASSYYSGPLGWWFRLSVPPEPPTSADFATRDRARRGRLAGSLLLGLLAIMALAVIIGYGDPVSLISALIGVGAVVVAVILNRSGFVNVAGFIMVAIPALVIILSIIGAPIGKDDTLYLPLFDLLAISIVVAASLLTPASVLVVTIIMIGFTIADLYLQWNVSPNIGPLLKRADGALTIIARPAAFQLIVGVIGFLWARSTIQSIRRADRAEELAELERRELDRTHELEEGVRQLLAVHVHLANGDFNVRAPAIRNSLLWQIGSSLNNLVARLGRLAQADFVLRRTQEEANRVTEALYMINSGRQPIWPAPSNTPLDRVVDVLRGSLTPRVAGGAPTPPQLPPSMGGYSGYSGMGASMPSPGPLPGTGAMGVPERPASAYSGAAPTTNNAHPANNPNNAVPDWMHSLMSGDGAGQMPPQPMAPADGQRTPMSGPPDAYGAPVESGNIAPPPPPDASPWSLEPSDPLDNSDLPEWLRQTNQDR